MSYYPQNNNYPQNNYGVQPYFQPNPGQGLGIAGFITSFFIWPLGLILSLISRSKSRAAGMRPTGLSTAGLVLSILGAVGSILWFFLLPQLSTGTTPWGW